MNYEITVEGRSGAWRADLTSPPRPGSPLIGTGRTKEMAVACLLFHLLGDENMFRHKLDTPSTLKVNGKPWQDAKGSRR